ncbi:MAG: PF20097 family protein [Planctomycetota bacterium]
MPTTKRVCPKCSSEMEQGVLVDHAHYGLPTRQTWAAGEMRKGWIGGERMPAGREAKVTTWRCSSCGYLESYAQV